MLDVSANVNRYKDVYTRAPTSPYLNDEVLCTFRKKHISFKCCLSLSLPVNNGYIQL